MPRRTPAPVVALVATALAGCPGSLDDPERFYDGGCVDVPSKLFVPTCGVSAGCHTATLPASQLDLVSPDVEKRLVDQPARTCTGGLVPRSSPTTGVFIRKLGDSVPCGERMPIGLPKLSSAQLGCVQAWIAAVVEATADGGVRDGV